MTLVLQQRQYIFLTNHFKKPPSDIITLVFQFVDNSILLNLNHNEIDQRFHISFEKNFKFK